MKIEKTEMMKNRILKMLKKALENIELEKLVIDGKLNHKIAKVKIPCNTKNTQIGDRTGALGSEQKLSEVVVAKKDLASKTMKMIKMNNQTDLRKDSDIEDLIEAKRVTKKKIMMMILLKDKSLIPKQVNH